MMDEALTTIQSHLKTPACLKRGLKRVKLGERSRFNQFRDPRSIMVPRSSCPYLFHTSSPDSLPAHSLSQRRREYRASEPLLTWSEPLLPSRTIPATSLWCQLHGNVIIHAGAAPLPLKTCGTLRTIQCINLSFLSMPTWITSRYFIFGQGRVKKVLGSEDTCVHSGRSSGNRMRMYTKSCIENSNGRAERDGRDP